MALVGLHYHRLRIWHMSMGKGKRGQEKAAGESYADDVRNFVSRMNGSTQSNKQSLMLESIVERSSVMAYCRVQLCLSTHAHNPNLIGHRAVLLHGLRVSIVFEPFAM